MRRLAGLGSRISVALVVHPGVGVERRRPSWYFTAKYALNALTARAGRRAAAPGPSRRAPTSSSPLAVISPNAPWQRQITASNSPSKRQRAGVEPLERGHRRARRATRELDEALRDVDAVHRDAAARELVRVATRPAPDVEHPHRPAPSPSASTRWSTSCTVPLVNEYRRYAAPRWSASSSNQWSCADLSVGLGRRVQPLAAAQVCPRRR